MDNSQLLDWLQTTGLASVLPLSPVQTFIHSHQSTFESIQTYAGYINWFVPVGWMVTVLSAWLFAIGVFYGVQWLLRTVNVIGS